MARKARPANRWRVRDASRSYVIGYTGVKYLPENEGFMAPSHQRYSAAVFTQPDPDHGMLLWWYTEGLGVIHAITEVRCGARISRKEAERDARDWAGLTRHGSGSFDLAAIGTFSEFDDLHHGGLVLETLRCAPDPIEAPALDVWDWDRDGPPTTATEPSDDWRWN
jgi:hypothetical protein